VTPGFVCRWTLPIAYLIFFASLVISAAIFYRGRPFDLKSVIISDLESPGENPRGYGVAAAGTAICGALLIPAVVVFYRRVRKRRALAITGAALFAIGLGAAIAIGLLAPSTRGYTPVHVQLAYAAFIGIAAGTVVYLAAVGGVRWLVWLQCGVVVFLLYLYFGPEFFTNDWLWRSLAFCEWMLCADCGVALWVLARRVAA